MGICYSSISGSNKRKKDEWEWKSGNENTSKLNLKLSKSHSGSKDLTSLISKISGGAAASVAEELAVHHIPGGLSGNGATRNACLYTQQGKKGTNQDAMIFWENFCSSKDAIFCGVFDGHGPLGHMVARKVRDRLTILLRTEWESITNNDQNCSSDDPKDEVLDDCKFTKDEGTENFPCIYLPLKKSILKAFKLMDKELKLHPTIDCFCSGTTAVTLLMMGQDLIIGNLGDSRAILARRDKDDSLMPMQLTIDLKPNLPDEAARIQKCEGRVFALQDEPEVARVWLPNSDSPGLAMARAFGDFCLKDFGLISIPDIYYHQITDRDEFVILATDGIWDVLSNKEAIDVVASSPSRTTAARALVESANRAWRLKFPTSKIDDCAVICLFMEHTGPGDLSQTEAVPVKALKEETQTTIRTAGPTITDSVFDNLIAVPDSSEMEPVVISAEEETQATIRTTGPTITNSVLVNHISVQDSSEIEPVVTSAEEKLPQNGIGQSRRSLAECISTAEDEEWSALEGLTRANSLLSIPRFLHFDKRSLSWRKWL